MTRVFILLFVIACFARDTYAQKLEFGIGIGASTYWGDLNGPDFGTNLRNSGLAVSLSGTAVYSKYLGARLNLSYGRVNGADSRSSNLWQRERNLSFYSNILELATMGEFYFFTYDEESIFVPYLTAGVALLYFDPKTKLNGVDYRLQPLGTEGQGLPGYKKPYSLVSLSIPFGAGGKLKINEKTFVYFEVVARRAFTDYLDDVSTRYVNYNEFLAAGKVLTANLANRMHEFRGTNELINLPTGTQRGGEKVKDYYFFTMIGMQFSMGEGFARKKGYKSNCPKF